MQLTRRIRTMLVAGLALSAIPSVTPVRADTLEMPIGAGRSQRPKGSMEARGKLVLDDRQGFVEGLLANGIKVTWEYTETADQNVVQDGDAFLTFTFDPASCFEHASGRVECQDREKRSYFRAGKVRTDPNAMKLKIMIRRTDPSLAIAAELGHKIRVVLETTEGGVPVTRSAETEKCGWLRGTGRTGYGDGPMHLKCPNKCRSQLSNDGPGTPFCD